MPNDFYAASGAPSQGSTGSSAVMRAEFLALVAAFDKLPGLAGNGGKLVAVNPGATGLTVSTSIDATPIGATTPSTGAFTTLSASGNVSLGDAQADTLSVGGVAIKNATGNWSIPAPSSGATFTATVLDASAVGFLIAGVSKAIRVQTTAALARLEAVDQTGSASYQPLALNGSTLNLEINQNSALSISANRNVTIAAPSSGTALSYSGGAAGDSLTLINTSNHLLVRPTAETNIGLATFANAVGTRRLEFLYAGTGSAGFYGITPGAVGINANAGPFVLATADTARLTIAAAGNVTIAAPSSGTALTVAQFAGAIGLAVTAASTDTARVDIAGNGNVVDISGFALLQDASNTARLFNRANAGMDFSTNAITRLTISAAGNVTIAAPSSGTALSVQGAAGAAPIVMNGVLANSFMAFQRSGAAIGDIGSGDALGGTSTQYGMVARPTYDLVLGSGGAVRQTISAAGNVTIAAPTSGVGLTQTGFAGSDTALFNGGTSGSFRVTDRGLPYGTSIHNNAGAVTGATNQYIASGTYTPTLTNVTNIGASTARQCQWMRVGNVVTVSGQFDYTCTAGTANSEVGVSLPIASAFTTQYQLGGSGGNYEAGVNSGGDLPFDADATNDRARCRFVSTRITGQTNMFTFMYEVL